MKKFCLIILPILLLCGCGKTKLDLQVSDTTMIIYDNMEIVGADYEKVLNELRKLEFKETKETFQENNFTINTISAIYNFNIAEDKIIYTKEDKNYISEEPSELLNALGNIKANYNNFSFYTITYRKNFNLEESSLLIDLANENEYIIITTTEPLKNFRINELEMVDDEFKEINLLYENPLINDKVIAIRVIPSTDIPNLKISFLTKYNYLVTIIPTYNDGQIEFKTTYIQK